MHVNINTEDKNKLLPLIELRLSKLKIAKPPSRKHSNGRVCNLVCIGAWNLSFAKCCKQLQYNLTKSENYIYCVQRKCALDQVLRLLNLPIA
jgi:hypothetical protein